MARHSGHKLGVKVNVKQTGGTPNDTLTNSSSGQNIQPLTPSKKKGRSKKRS